MASLGQLATDWIGVLHLPANAKAALRNDQTGLAAKDPGPEHVIRAGIAWLARAQDCSATRDGGVARHYSLIDGWAASYPETTGYIVSTLIDYGRESKLAQPIDRAKRMLDWLVSIQFPNGAFQGGMVNQAPRVPVSFNTGQILIGLAAGATLESRYRESMRRAADWLVQTQDSDGAWRKWTSPFGSRGEKTFDTHIARGLIEAFIVDGNGAYLESALKQVDWALKAQSANGWLARCCLSDHDRPLTHTLGYALRGVLAAHLISHREQYLNAACRIADGLMSALQPDGRLPGRLLADWKPAANWVCLTGTAQIAESWFLLYHLTGHDRYKDSGRRANNFVRRTVSIDGDENTSGGVKGSFPINGGYGRWEYLNWACKFMIDANRAELATPDLLPAPPRTAM